MSEFLGKLSIAEAMNDIYGQKVRIVTSISGFIFVSGLMSLVLGWNPSPFRRQEALVDQVERKFCVSKLRTLQLTADGCSVGADYMDQPSEIAFPNIL